MKLLRVLGDRTVAGIVVAAGMIALLIGWIGVSGTAYPAEQIPYLLSGGVLGAALIGIGATVWLSSDLHDEWRKLDRVEELLTELIQASDSSAVPGPVATTNGSTRAKVRQP